MDPISSAQAIKALLANLGTQAGKSLGMAGRGVEKSLGFASRSAPGLGEKAGYGLARGADLARKNPKAAGGIGLGLGGVGAASLFGDDSDEDESELDANDPEYEELLEQLKRR